MNFYPRINCTVRIRASTALYESAHQLHCSLFFPIAIANGTKASSMISCYQIRQAANFSGD